MFWWVGIYDQKHSLIIPRQEHESKAVALNALPESLMENIKNVTSNHITSP